MAQLRPKIVKLAKIIGGVTGITTKIDENAPEYYCMAGILSDDEADIAIAAGLRKERTAGYLAKKVGKTVQEVQPLLDNLVYYGIFRRSMDKALGEDVYYMQIFAPGILEMMVNQKELLETHPEVGRAFDEYTRNLAANMGAMIPDGYGLMRVIPVESALEGIEGVSDYERISHYLDKYDRFSVSPCSCRASRSSLGDGCGHLEEDMCVQMGRGAEHYIRTGRAREITREQALEIIQRAEENGLMHDMVNIEEPGESAAICNCCACACFGLRVGLMFGARDAIRSNYVAEVDEAKCVACGQCVETCPGNALKLGQKLCSTEDLTPQPDYVKLSETIHPKRSWNPDYREDHEDVMPTGTAPCKTACPAHVPVQGYLKLAAQGRYTDALELIKKENPFPAVCGRICNKRCEAECTRGAVDEAVAIDEVKRFIADHDLHEATRFVPKLCNQIGRPYTEKIAVIGAGPAGMSCAYYLANKGYPVTVFDRNPVPGGMLTLGIPNFRLEKDVLNAEIDILREMGVEFRCGVEVGRDITIGQLRAQGYKGFYVAIGAQKSARLGVAGEELTGVYGGVDFLRAVNLGKRPTIGKQVAVIGGGNVAIDVARAAVRRGADVTLLYRRGREEMPAADEEVAEAEAEGVKFRFLCAPVEILGEKGKATAIKVETMTLGEPDEKGRRKPVGTGEFETLAVSAVISAIGQQIDLCGIDAGSKLRLGKRGTVLVDPATYQTAEPDVFAGGDLVTGPKFAIDAIAAGKEAAVSIHRFVHPGQSQLIGRDHRDYKSLDPATVAVPIESFDNTPRQHAHDGSAEEAKKTFHDLRGVFTEEQMKKETERCLGCGAVVLNEDQCIGCGICTTKCKFDAIRLEKVNDTHGREYFRTLLTVAGNTPAAIGRLVRKTRGR